MHLDARRHLMRDPWFSSGLFLLVLMAGTAFLGPSLAPHDPHDISFVPLSPPSVEHWLGVNDGGMDIMSELIYGLRNTLCFGLAAGAFGLLIGVMVGLSAAWLGGWVDQLFMRLADVFLAIPAVMLLIVLAAFFRPSPMLLALTLALLAWPATAKAIRSQALVLKKSLHIQA